MARQNWLYWHKSVDVADILDIADKEVVSEASTFGGMREDYRRSKVAWLTGNNILMDIMLPYVFEAAKVMDITIDGTADIQYTEYHGSEGGKYDWHHDVDWNNDSGIDRKLSVTIQLSEPSDYEGGHFQFGGIEEPKPESRDKGTILVFPSYLPHCVTPVTSGVRKSLVAWFEGPTWR